MTFGENLKSWWDWGTQPVWVYREKFNIDFLAQFFFDCHTCVGTPQKKLGQKTNVKFFRVYTNLWGTFNCYVLAKMEDPSVFSYGHYSPDHHHQRRHDMKVYNESVDRAQVLQE